LLDSFSKQNNWNRQSPIDNESLRDNEQMLKIMYNLMNIVASLSYYFASFRYYERFVEAIDIKEKKIDLFANGANLSKQDMICVRTVTVRERFYLILCCCY